MFFDVAENLCERYPALHPIALRREKFGEVMLLVRRINIKNDAKKGIRRSDKVHKDDDGNIVIRRPATSDNWY